MFNIQIFNFNIENFIVFLSNNSFDVYLWYFLLVLLIIGGIILGALLLVFSNKPFNWEHIPISNNNFPVGKLINFADSIKNDSLDINQYSSLKNQIDNLFFEKISTVNGLSINEIIEIKQKNPEKLKKIVRDNDINNWIFSPEIFREKTGIFNYFKKNKDQIRQKNLLKINVIIDKMEAWGE